MRIFLVLSFVLFGLSSIAQDSWQAPGSAKEINNPYAGNKIATQKGQAALLEFITDKELALSTF